ncbi:hypothetical protein L1276_001138 [Flavobacterium sp. HSC-32F16]|uniref:hypothetical protein n=1 Tax=Flavobacterium sp. HSC-32F16 TaxID=2910964 RepID=UPI0020A4BBAA|nr:hypothetical protein [Flavobacterium sp. HSC-32F16]MCP2025998.1 hypothetical protein [Flavobacterium sp. HSC-32F16]
MKKYASLIFLAFLLNGCDDGDLTVDEINFDSVTPVSCTTFTENSLSTDPVIIYKLKTQEALILQLPQTEGIVNDNNTVTYDIDNAQYRVLYRAYSGTVAKDNICGTIPPSSPNVTEEWVGSAGKIKIVSSQVPTDIDANDSFRIKAYNHAITFENITFQKPAGPQVEALFEYGTFQTTVTPADLTFINADTGEAKKCDDNTKVYNYNASFTLTVENLDPALLLNEATPPGQPRSQAVSATTNKVVYRNFVNGSGSITDAYNFCAAQIPTVPALRETWIGTDTSEAKKATVEVTTEKIGDNTFIHTVVLKNIKLTKDNSYFQLGNTFLLGKITVTI